MTTASEARPVASPWEKTFKLSLIESEQQVVTQLRCSIADVLTQPEISDWVTDSCLARYLRARSWNLAAAEKMIRETVKWRLETKPHLLQCDHCLKDPFAHSMRQIGFDSAGRPLLYSVLHPRGSREPEENLRHLICILEHTIHMLPKGIEKITWVIDLHGFKMADASPSQGRMCGSVLSNHYPERLYKAFIIDGPAIFRGFWSICKTVLHAETIAKVCMTKYKKGKAEKMMKPYIDDDVLEWILREMAENRDPEKFQDRMYWCKNAGSDHDPRGVPEWTNNWRPLLPPPPADFVPPPLPKK